MGRRYRKRLSNAGRKLTIHLRFNRGKTPREIAEDLGVGIHSVRKLCSIFIKELRVEAKNAGGRKQKYGPEMEQMIKNYFTANVDATLSECKKFLSQNLGTPIGEVPSISIDRIVHKSKLTWKTLSRVPERRNDDETIELRKRYATKYLQLEGKVNFIFLDEFGCHVSMRRGRGRSLRNTRAFIQANFMKGKNCSVIAAMDSSGILHYESQYSGITAEAFLKFLRNLNRKLDKSKHNVLVMDNLRAHKTEAVKTFINEVGLRTLHTAPYSPMLNPIENCFSKVKAAIRKFNIDGEGLNCSIERAFSTVTPLNCIKWINHAKRYFPQCLTGTPIFVEPEELGDESWSSDDEAVRI